MQLTQELQCEQWAMGNALRRIGDVVELTGSVDTQSLMLGLLMFVSSTTQKTKQNERAQVVVLLVGLASMSLSLYLCILSIMFDLS